MTQPTPQQPPSGQPTPPPADGRWPAWLVDTAIALAAAAVLSAAFAAALPRPSTLAQALLSWAGKRSKPKPAEVRRWVESYSERDDGRERMAHRVEVAVAKELDKIAKEGGMVGVRSARAVLDHVEEHAELPGEGVTLATDWGRWTPGNPEAARQILSEDGKDTLLYDLMRRNDVTAKGITATRLDDIAAVLADGLERGASIDEIAMALRGIWDNPTWANTVAWTETNRAISAAALAEYAADGIGFSEWMTAMDQRVCPHCLGNELHGPVAIGQRFPSGDLHPPGHPRCRCGLLPVIDGIDDPDDLDKAARGGDNSLEHYWKNGEGRARWVGTAHPTTALQRHLRKHMSPARAWRTAAKWHHDVFGTWPGQKGKK